MHSVPFQTDPELIPLVIGVTGYRELRHEDLKILEAKVRVFFIRLHENYPNTPLILLSSLQEGADRIVARMALGLPFPIRLIAVLPTPRPLYEEEIKRGKERNSLAAFEFLLHQASEIIELPLLSEPSPRDAPPLVPSWEEQYRQAGAYIARHCQILMALWSGESTPDSALSEQTLRYKLEGIADARSERDSPLKLAECGPVYHIVTPSPGKTPDERPTFKGFRLFPDGCDADHFDRMYERIDHFNQDNSIFSPGLDQFRQHSEESFLPPETKEHVPPALRLLQRRFVQADALARYAFLREDQIRIGVVVLGLAALLFHQFDWKTSFLVGLFCIFVWLARSAKGEQLSQQGRDYQALAEGLRIQYFWRLNGFSHSAADALLKRQANELDWIRHGLSLWDELPDGAESHSPTPYFDPEKESHSVPASPARIDRLLFTLTFWLDRQSTLTRKTVEKREEKWERLQEGSVVLLLFGLSLASIQALIVSRFSLRLPLTLIVALLILSWLFRFMRFDVGSKAEKKSRLRHPMAVPAGPISWEKARWFLPYYGGLLAIFAIGLPLAEPQLASLRFPLVDSLALLAGAGSLSLYLWGRLTDLPGEIRFQRQIHSIYRHSRQRMEDLLKTGQYDQAGELLRETGEAILRLNGDRLLLERDLPKKD